MSAEFRNRLVPPSCTFPLFLPAALARSGISVSPGILPSDTAAMTLALAWIRKVGTTSELVLAADIGIQFPFPPSP